MTAATLKNKSAVGMTVHAARMVPQAPDAWTTYTLGEKIATGGFADLHQVIGHPALIAKIYNDKMKDRLQKKPRIIKQLWGLARDSGELQQALPFATWPRSMLFSQARPIGAAQTADTLLGYTMHRIVGTTSLHDLVVNPDRRLRLTAGDTAFIAKRIADQLAQLHRHDRHFVFGDFSPANIHIGEQFDSVTFIDTDGYQYDFKEKDEAFDLEMITPGFRSPGVTEAIRDTGRVTTAHDDYVLAIHIFTVLMLAHGVPRHPLKSGNIEPDVLIAKRAFPYDDPQTYPLPQSCLTAYRSFPEGLRKAFTRTFTTPNGVTAEDWGLLLHDHRRFLRRRKTRYRRAHRASQSNATRATTLAAGAAANTPRRSAGQTCQSRLGPCATPSRLIASTGFACP